MICAGSTDGSQIMSRKRWVIAMLVLGSLALAGSASAGGAGGEIGIGFTFAPGQQGTSPGQVFNAARATDPTTALPPGKLYLQNKSTDPTTALPPGQTFTNYGRSKK